MIGGGLSLALVPAPLVLAALLIYGLPSRAHQPARVAGASACAVTLALLGLSAAQISGGGRIEVSYGAPVTGIDVLVRADALGMLLSAAATAMAALALLERSRPPLEVGALLVSVLGAVLAAIAGNAIVLFAGIEIATVGTALGLAAGRRRPGRGAVAALTLMHLACLGVLAAAAQLLTAVGTAEFTALPDSAVVAAVAAPWAVGGAVLLLSPAVLPLRSPGGPCTILAGVGVVPAGITVLLRLREAANGSIPEPVVVALAVAGAAVALGGALAAVRWAASPLMSGRGLVLVSAAGVVAMSGVSTTPAAGAMAAGICSVVLATGLASLWEASGGSRSARWAGAAALAAAGGAPTGFAVVAIALEIAAALALGGSGAALVVCFAVSGALAVTGASRAALNHLATAPGRSTGRVSLVGIAALTASLIAALLPGAVATWVISALAGSGAVHSVGPAAATLPAGGWAQGYFLPATLVVLMALVAVARLQGWPLPAAPAVPAGEPARPRPTWSLALSAGRRIRGPVRAGERLLGAVDGWLMVQPQLPLVLVAGVLAVVLIH
ncbi:MAG: hypothetical protein E6J45_02795 [Chloroflexi bacterium]|nr:MAG: hypothetical protein E6J45_02795 [Chloroflexota bacterium]